MNKCTCYEAYIYIYIYIYVCVCVCVCVCVFAVQNLIILIKKKVFIHDENKCLNHYWQTNWFRSSLNRSKSRMISRIFFKKNKKFKKTLHILFFFSIYLRFLKWQQFFFHLIKKPSQIEMHVGHFKRKRRERKSGLNKWFCWVWFDGTSTIVGYLMPNTFYTYILNIWFGLVGFYGISTIVGYLMQNPGYIYILNIYDSVWLGFMAYQPL